MISALRRVQRENQILKRLLVCEPPTNVNNDSTHFDVTAIGDDGPGLKIICDGISLNSHLQEICFDAPLGPRLSFHNTINLTLKKPPCTNFFGHVG